MFNPFAPAVWDLICSAIEDARKAYADCAPDLREERLRFAIGDASQDERMKVYAATRPQSPSSSPISNEVAPLDLTQDGFILVQKYPGRLESINGAAT